MFGQNQVGQAILPAAGFPPSPVAKDNRSGMAMVLAVLCCLTLVPMMGLAVDGANVYLMRNQISTALNASVLAGARSLSVGQTDAEQQAAVQLIAGNTFAANISGMNSLMTITTAPVFTIVPGPGHIRKVTSSVTASLPLLLMGILNQTSTRINVTATAQRRDVNIILVLDHSGPMNDIDAASGLPILEVMKTNAATFVNMFSNVTDRVGLITYATGAYVADSPNTNFKTSVTSHIAALAADPNSLTNTPAALEAAYQQLLANPQPGALNVVVLFTDSNPGGFTANLAGLIATPAFCDPAANPIPGVIWTNQQGNLQGGPADPEMLSLNDDNENRGPSPACSGDYTNLYRLLTQLPAVDAGGYSTAGTFAPVDLTSFNDLDITAASQNVLDNAASAIRSDLNLTPVIFVIGLGGNTWIPPDPVLMPRIANDPASTSYNSSQPAGQYIYAPTPSQLQSAFVSIASQVLHLAR